MVEFESVRRTPRYSLIVDIEITDIQLEIQITVRTKMLSMSGCGVETVTLLPKGAGVRVKLSHQGAEVNALARIVYSSLGLGMGVAFTSVEQEDERILECWIADFLSVPIL
jgi:PilZ domain